MVLESVSADNQSDPQILDFDSETSNLQTGMALMWNNLIYCETTLFGRVSTSILSGLKGEIRFGTLTALMGPSGSGKTTLLRCINGLNRWGLNEHTEIYVRRDSQIIPCFIVQDIDDHLLPVLTVKESLMYASLLKNRTHIRALRAIRDETGESLESILNRNIDSLVHELMLTECANNLVNQCSGGEQKRLVIAMELTSLVKPNLLCIDEPTSGLDSCVAEKLVLCLQSIAHKHRLAVVTSIHQPNSDALMMFDQLYVLARGGRCVYSGAPDELRNHLTNCQIQCNQYQSPIEVLLKISSVDVSQANEHSIETTEELDRLIHTTDQILAAIDFDCTENLKPFDGVFDDIKRTLHWRDMWYLLRRQFTCTWIRGWKTIIAVFVINNLLGLILSLTYDKNFGADPGCVTNDSIRHFPQSLSAKLFHTQDLVEENFANIFFSSSMNIFIIVLITIFSFTFDMKVYLNEHRNLWYSTSSYFCTKTLIDMPYMLVIAFVYNWVGYWIADEPDLEHWYNGVWAPSERYLLYTSLVCLQVVNIQGYAMLFGVLFFRNVRLASLTCVALYMFSLLFTGFYVPVIHYPQYILMFSPTKILIDSLLIVIFGRNRCPGNRSTILEKLGLSDDQLVWNVWKMCAHVVMWRLLTLISLLLIANYNSLLSSQIRRQTRKYSTYFKLN